MVQYVMSATVSPYNLKGTGEGVGVLVGCGVGCGVDVCLDEHDKRRFTKTTVSINILILIFRRSLRVYSLRTAFFKTPNPSISTTTSSPCFNSPTPAGVPVKIKSPGSSVMTDEIYAIKVPTFTTISRVEAI
jgi:hypothetical protein